MVDEQRFINIQRNYSRKEGGEMFSLTVNREIEKGSSFLRKKVESYIALYDVQTQVLEEMTMFDFVTPDFLEIRKKDFAKRLKIYKNKLNDRLVELEKGNEIVDEKEWLEDTIHSIEERIK